MKNRCLNRTHRHTRSERMQAKIDLLENLRTGIMNVLFLTNIQEYFNTSLCRGTKYS